MSATKVVCVYLNNKPKSSKKVKRLPWEIKLNILKNRNVDIMKGFLIWLSLF